MRKLLEKLKGMNELLITAGDTFESMDYMLIRFVKLMGTISFVYITIQTLF